MSVQNYAFIDGNYMRRAYEDTLRQILPEADHGNLDYGRLKMHVGASKVFFYDAVDDSASNAGDRREHLERIRSLEGFHVREGTLSSDKKRQKQVDVQLAVDCLTHAFNKNFWLYPSFPNGVST